MNIQRFRETFDGIRREAGKLIKEALPSGGKIMLFVGKLDARNAAGRDFRRRPVVAEHHLSQERQHLQRARMLEIQAQKSEELSQGYQHDDPIYYSKGPQWWASTLEKWYAPPLFLAYLFGGYIGGKLGEPSKPAVRHLDN